MRIRLFTFSLLAGVLLLHTSSVHGQAPDPNDTTAVVDFLTWPRADSFIAGLPELQEVVRNDPARFAPILRERLIRVPKTLDEYSPDDSRWSVSAPYNEWAPFYLILTTTQLLGREHAEPILRDFFDRVQPLAVASRERVWAFEDAWRAAGKPKERGPNAREPWDTWARFRNAREQTIMLAQKLESPIFIDDVLAMLTSDSVAVHDAGASMADYVLHFASARPDAVQKLRDAVVSLAQSSSAKDRSTSAVIRRKLEKAGSNK